jgi:hypothetical protein
MNSGQVGLRAVAIAISLVAASPAISAEGDAWTIGKMSGQVWVTAGGVQPVALSKEDTLKPGEMVRTGPNGRVLLIRGKETVLISPNSVVGLPDHAKEGLSTTIIQRAGSILLDVEKRNVKHFEVETPYLAAVVKGTNFRVTVNSSNTSVEVVRGQVEVDGFRSGQIAQVLPGQKATAREHGAKGIVLSGSGKYLPIEQGKPRPISIERVRVPKGGLIAPRDISRASLTLPRSGLDHANNNLDKRGASGHRRAAGNGHGTRISSAIGDVRLNFQKVTHGLARGNSASHGASRGNNDATIWNASAPSSNGVNGNSNGANGTPSVAASVTSVTNAGARNVPGRNENAAGKGNGNAFGRANGNGNGNGNGHGNGNGASGNSNGHSNGNGNGNGQGNANGNGHGNGNGNSNGHGKN